MGKTYDELTPAERAGMNPPPVADEAPATTGGVTEATDGADSATTTTETPVAATEAEFESEVAADAGLTTLGDI